MQKISMTTATWIIVVSIFTTTSVARAEEPGDHHSAFYSGNRLYQLCTDATGSSERGQCVGFVAGVSDVVTNVAGADRIAQVCTPDQVQLRQMVDVVTAYLRDHPADRHASAVVLTWVALALAWPCP